MGGQSVGAARSNQLAGHVSPLSDLYKNLNKRVMAVGSIMLRKNLYPLSVFWVSSYLGNENPGAETKLIITSMSRMGLFLDPSLHGAP